MENDSGIIIVFTLLIVSAFLLIVFMLAKFFTRFNRDTRYIVAEMNRATEQSEYRYWRRELRCHYLYLIPFVTERNVMWLYHRLYHRSKHNEKNRIDGLSHLLVPSVVSACVCAVCLCGASWAWFTASSSAGTAEIRTASYTVSVTATRGEDLLSAKAAENGAITFFLEAGKEYKIEIKPTGNAATGYCKLNFGNKDYYTGQCTSGTLFFTVYAGDSGTLTVAPEWGTCAVASEDNTVNDGGKIDTRKAPASTSTANDEGADQEQQSAVPANTATTAQDAPATLPESGADEESETNKI